VIDCNTRELAQLSSKVEGVIWEVKRMADMSDWKGKGKMQPKESDEEEEKWEEMDGMDEDGQGNNE